MAYKIGDRLAYVPRVKLGLSVSEPKNRKWCAIATEYRAEWEAAGRIGELGYSVYVPRFKTEIRDRSKNRASKLVDRPLFDGYLFARLNPIVDPWGDLERLPGVRSLVKAVEMPLSVPDQLIAELQALEPHNFSQPIRKRDQAAIALPVGASVRVIDGPLTGFFGKLKRSVDSHGRIAALVELLGRLITVDLASDQVEPA